MNPDEGLRALLPGFVLPFTADAMVNDRVCLCGASNCAGLSSAFRILGRKDPRSLFHKVPRRKKKGDPDRAAIDAIRKAYLHALFPQSALRPLLQPRQDYWIAKHHFHPTLVHNFPRLPYTLPEDIMLEHKVNVQGWKTLSTLLTAPHPCQDSFMVVPNYSQEQARNDLQSLLREEERLRLYKSRSLRRKSGNSLSEIPRLLGEGSPPLNTPGSMSKAKRLSESGGDDPTEVTCSTSASWGDSPSTPDVDLYYEQSKRIVLPPPPLIGPEDDEEEEEENLLGSTTDSLQTRTLPRSSWSKMNPTSSLSSDRSRATSYSPNENALSRKASSFSLKAPPSPRKPPQRRDSSMSSSNSSGDKKPMKEVIIDTKEAEALQVGEKEAMSTTAQGQIGTCDPPRPTTLASLDHSPEELARHVKYINVRTISERRARKKGEWKYLILFNDSLARRPNTGVFTIPAVVADKKELDSPDLVMPSEDAPLISDPSVLSRLAAIVGDDGPDLICSPPPETPKSPTILSDSSGDESSDTESKKSYMRKLQPWVGLRTSIPRPHLLPDDSDTSCSSLDSDDDSHQGGSVTSHHSMLDLSFAISFNRDRGAVRQGSFLSQTSAQSLPTPKVSSKPTTPERVKHAFKNSGKPVDTSLASGSSSVARTIFQPKPVSVRGENVKDKIGQLFPSKVSDEESSSTRSHVSLETFLAKENSGSKKNMTDTLSTVALFPTEVQPELESADKEDEDKDPMRFMGMRKSSESFAFLPELAPNVSLIEIESVGSCASLMDHSSEGSAISLLEIESEGASDSSTDSGESSGVPYNGSGDVARKPEASSKVPSGVLVTVLETSHLQPLLGDGDDDSDFEEKWEKTNKNGRKVVAVPRAAAPACKKSLSEKSVARLQELSRHDQRKPSYPTESPHALKKPPPQASVDSHEITSIKDSGASSIVGNIWDSVDGDANAVDALASMLDDVEGGGLSGSDMVPRVDASQKQTDSEDPTDSDTGEGQSLDSPQNDQTRVEVHPVVEVTEACLSALPVEGGVPEKPVEDSIGETAKFDDYCSPGLEEDEKDSIPDECTNQTENDSSSELDKSLSTQDISNSLSGDDDSDCGLYEETRSHSQNDTETAGDTVSSNAINTLSSAEEQEEVAYLEMLLVEEDERHEWFVHMQDTIEAEYKAYLQVLATMKAEADQVDRLMDYSHQAIDIYTNTIAELCTDPSFAAPKGTGKECVMESLVNSYKALASRFQESLPGLEASVQEMASYKFELARSIRVIENRGLRMLQELVDSEEGVRKCWGHLEESTSRAPGDSTSRDRWLDEVDYRQSVTKHLSLWRDRTADLNDVTTRILEMEGECHQRLKNILLGFLPKRHDLFRDVRGMLDTAVDALETSTLLSEMSEIDKRLEQAVIHFQPGKKRSILSISLVSANDKHSTVPSLDDFASLAAVNAEALKKSENVYDYSFVQIPTGEQFHNVLAVVTRQHFLHIYSLPPNCAAASNNSSINEQEIVVASSLKAGPPKFSLNLVPCTFKQVESRVEIRSPQEDAVSEEGEGEATVAMQFPSEEDATEWVAETEKLCTPSESSQVEPKSETNNV